MKFAFLLFLIPISQSFALDLSNNNAREISDLMYLPESGTKFISLSVSSTSSEADVEYLTNNLYSEESKSVTAELLVGSSINDKFAWALEVPYSLKNDEDTKYGPASVSNGTTDSTKTNGLEDLNFRLKWSSPKKMDSFLSMLT